MEGVDGAARPQMQVYNTLSRRKEDFMPQEAGRVGIYLCGPTVYGDAHLGHARSAIVFDVMVRYMRLRGLQVRYVRNITDVGHLEQDADEGEDKIAVRARTERVEPMEVAQRYTNSYHADLARLGCEPPSIEPHASGHIIEQIEMIRQIQDRGLAYEVNGSVYFDVTAYQGQTGAYGRLSGRQLDQMLEGSRENLKGQDEKRSPADFALWKRADERHIMRWPSPWSVGFPGWHIECSAMSAKYLGPVFDIHGGGMDLLFPHHEAELAQSQACHPEHAAGPARYWMHVNMVQINGQKMGKSLGNFITLGQFFAGTHEKLAQAYDPMTIRAFILQAHYRSTIDFSNEALQAASKAYHRLMNGLLVLERLEQLPLLEATGAAHLDAATLAEIEAELLAPHQALSDDLNTATCLAALFALLKRIQGLAAKPESLAAYPSGLFGRVADVYRTFLQQILGLVPEAAPAAPLREGLLAAYRQARQDKNWPEVDRLRQVFKQAGLVIQDGKTGSVWAWEE